MSAKIAAEETQPQLEPLAADEIDSGKYGKPLEYDPKFAGPIEKRGCTDVLCLLLLVVFIVGWCVIAAIAFKRGDPSVLVHPVDSRGRKCGMDEPVKNRQYLFFFDITQCAKAKVLLYGCKTPQVCVEKCPDFGPWSIKKAKDQNKKDNEIRDILRPYCRQGAPIDDYSIEDLVKKRICPEYILPTKTLARRCIPDLSNVEELRKEDGMDPGTIQKGIEQLLKFLNAKENFEFVFEDLRNSWVIILGCLAVGAVFSLIWICLMRCIAGVMVWLSLLGMIVVLSFSCYFSTVKYIELNKMNNTEEFQRHQLTEQSEYERFISEEEIHSQLDQYLKLKTTWLVFAIITGVLLGLLLLIVIFIRSRLSIAVALIKQGARAVGDMTFTLGWPLIPWLMQLIVIFWFVAVGFFLATATSPVHQITQNCTCTEGISMYENEECDISNFNKTCPKGTACGDVNACQFMMFQKLPHVGWLHLYNFFGLLWLLCFVNDLDDMVLAGSFAGWYWTFNRSKNLTTFPVLSSLGRTVKYHLGTLAFGSLIISIIKFIRFFLEYVDYKVRQYNENPVAKAVLCCMKCCFWCLEKFMKFINRNAYIMVAVYGKNFCTAARDSFFLLMRNALRAFVLDKVTDFLLFMGKLVITGGVAIGSFYLFTQQTQTAIDSQIPELHFYLMPVIIITFGTYFIASLFFSVYNMAVDTLFLCFLEDCERNDGTPEKPYYMPKELMEILGKKNKQIENGKND